MKRIDLFYGYKKPIDDYFFHVALMKMRLLNSSIDVNMAFAASAIDLLPILSSWFSNYRNREYKKYETKNFK